MNAKTEGAQNAQAPRGLSIRSRRCSESSECLGPEHSEHLEHAKSLWVYRHAHGAAPRALHGQLKDIYSIDCYYPKLLQLSRAPYSFDIGLNSLITPLVIHPD